MNRHLSPGYSFFAAWGLACATWGLIAGLACSSTPPPAGPALRRNQVECLLARQGELMGCVDPNKTRAQQIDCIDAIPLDCHDAGPPPEGGARD